MRQSLSENVNTPKAATGNRPAAGYAVLAAVVLSVVVAVAGIVDQAGGHTLTDHADAV